MPRVNVNILAGFPSMSYCHVALSQRRVGLPILSLGKIWLVTKEVRFHPNYKIANLYTLFHGITRKMAKYNDDNIFLGN